MRFPFFLSVILCALCGSSDAAEPRPNFMIIIADDLCWRDLGYEGSPDVKTPNLDKLRSESMHLCGMFNPATSCSPTRHALYTGLYPIRSGAYPNHTRVYDGTKSLFTHLKAAGWMLQQMDKGLETEILANTRQGKSDEEEPESKTKSKKKGK